MAAAFRLRLNWLRIAEAFSGAIPAVTEGISYSRSRAVKLLDVDLQEDGFEVLLLTNVCEVDTSVLGLCLLYVCLPRRMHGWGLCSRCLEGQGVVFGEVLTLRRGFKFTFSLANL